LAIFDLDPEKSQIIVVLDERFAMFQPVCDCLFGDQDIVFEIHEYVVHIALPFHKIPAFPRQIEWILSRQIMTYDRELSVFVWLK
jgi:hypothetical protein